MNDRNLRQLLFALASLSVVPRKEAGQAFQDYKFRLTDQCFYSVVPHINVSYPRLDLKFIHFLKSAESTTD